MRSPLSPLRALAKALRPPGAEHVEEAPSPLAPAPSPAAERRPRTRTGKYDDALAAIVRKRPGVTVAQAAGELGVAPPALYQVIRRLEERGTITKRGRGLHPPSGPTRKPRVGKHDERLAAVVGEEPGITVAEAAARLDLHPTALYPVIRRLEAAGAVVKRGRELHPHGD